MSNTDIASAMIDGLATIPGVTVSEVSLSGESPSFVVAFPARSDGKRRPSRIPPQTQRRTIQGNGNLVIAVLA